MAVTALNPTQQLRSRQIFQSHKFLKELNEATEDAVRCHDRYFAALEKVMTCLLNNSDILEEVRHTTGPDGAAVASTALPTGQLVSAYTNWKSSPELDGLRGELEALRVLSTEGRHTAKTTKLASENLERCAKKCVSVNSADYQAKIAHAEGRRREKLMDEARAENAKLVQLDVSLYRELLKNSVWWSTKLAWRTNELYGALARLGSRTAAVFPAPLYGGAPAAGAPASAVPTPLGAYQSVNEPGYGSARSAGPPASSLHASGGSNGNGAPYTTGVPLDFYQPESTKSVE